MRLAGGIVKVDGVRVANAYLVTTDDGLLLVDSGMPGSQNRILAAVRGLGFGPRDVRTIVLTHWHPDHVGSAAALRGLTGARIAIHELDAPFMAGTERPDKGRLMMAALIRLFRVRPVVADVLLREGDTISGFCVMHVPGHTAGSVVLHREDGVAFTGDALLSDKRGNVLPPNRSLSLDPDQAMASADRIRELRATLILTGHGAPATR